MSILLAIFAAVANAAATVLQRLGVESVTTGSATTRKLMAAVLRRPIWFAGLALTTASFLLQSVALAFGNLTSVQPVMVTEIVFLVLILGIWFHQRLGWREWVGTIGTAIGLGVFLGLSYSRRGTGQPDFQDWVLLLAAAGAAIVISLICARHGSRSFRAAAYGASTGIVFALTATFIKTVANEWQQGPRTCSPPRGVCRRGEWTRWPCHQSTRARIRPGRGVASGAPHRESVVEYRHRYLAIQ